MPDGLRAVYVVLVAGQGDDYKQLIIDRPVDAVAVLEIDATDIRHGGPAERKGARRGRKTKVAGIIMEGVIDPQPAPLATAWIERLYGKDFVGAQFLGYTRGESIDSIMEAIERGDTTPELDETRRYWTKAAKSAVERLRKSL